MMLKSGCLFWQVSSSPVGPGINESAMAQALLRKRERADSALIASEAGNFDPPLGTLPSQQRPLFVGPTVSSTWRAKPTTPFHEPINSNAYRTDENLVSH